MAKKKKKGGTKVGNALRGIKKAYKAGQKAKASRPRVSGSTGRQRIHARRRSR